MEITEDQIAAILDQARTLYETRHAVDPGPDCLGKIAELENRPPNDPNHASVVVTGTLADGQQVTMVCFIMLGENNGKPTAKVSPYLLRGAGDWQWSM